MLIESLEGVRYILMVLGKFKLDGVKRILNPIIPERFSY